MSRNGILRCLGGVAVVATAVVVGCETLHNAGVPGLEPYIKRDPEVVEAERSNREKFSIHRDHKALYWLLAHCVGNGMELREVEEVLGCPGEETTDFNGAHTDGLHQMTETAYKWGPDNSGHSVVIWFRDGHVSNFNRKDYQTLEVKDGRFVDAPAGFDASSSKASLN